MNPKPSSPPRLLFPPMLPRPQQRRVLLPSRETASTPAPRCPRPRLTATAMGRCPAAATTCELISTRATLQTQTLSQPTPRASPDSNEISLCMKTCFCFYSERGCGMFTTRNKKKIGIFSLLPPTAVKCCCRTRPLSRKARERVHTARTLEVYLSLSIQCVEDAWRCEWR